MGQIESSEPRSRLQLGVLFALVVLLAAAGAAAGFVFDSTRDRFDAKLPDVPTASEKSILEGIELQKAGRRKSSAFGCAGAGAIIVGVFGLFLGLNSRSSSRIAIGAVGGVAFGAALGAASGCITQALSDYTISHGVSSTTAYFVISGAFWLGIGLAAMLTSALAGSRRISAGARIGGPIMGAVMAAVLTPILASIVFPLDFNGRIPPRETAECYFVGAVGAALLAMGTGINFRVTEHP